MNSRQALWSELFVVSRARQYAEHMKGSRVVQLWLLFAIALGTAHAVRPGVPASEIAVTPALVEAGSPELIRVEAADANSVDGEWMGRKLAFFRAKDGRAWFALAGADVETSAGSSTIGITVHTAGG